MEFRFRTNNIVGSPQSPQSIVESKYPNQGRIFRTICFTQNVVILRKTGKKRSCVWTKKWPKTCEGADLAQNLDSACLKTPMTTFGLTVLMDLKFFLCSNFEFLPLLHEGTTAEFLALGSSHNRP